MRTVILAQLAPTTRLAAGGARGTALVLRGTNPYEDCPVLVDGLPLDPEWDMDEYADEIADAANNHGQED